MTFLLNLAALGALLEIKTETLKMRCTLSSLGQMRGLDRVTEKRGSLYTFD